MDIQQQQRRADGTFAPGNRIGVGRGNPLAAQVYNLKQAMVSACTPEVMRALTEHLLTLCHDEDKKVALQAMELLFDRLMGRAKVQAQIEMEVSQGGPTLDYSTISDADLATLDRIMDKTTRQG